MHFGNTCRLIYRGGYPVKIQINILRMKTQGLNLAGVNPLGREEMKKIMAGKLPGCAVYSGCSCDGSVGSWVYNTPVVASSASDDVIANCRSGAGHCTYSSGDGYC
jgi:hypothetical protein